MRLSCCPVATLATAIALPGEARLPHEHGYTQSGEPIQARLGTAPVTSPDAAAATLEIPAEALPADPAGRLVLFCSPGIDAQFARLGRGRAEAEDAPRRSNPTSGYAQRDARSIERHNGASPAC